MILAREVGLEMVMGLWCLVGTLLASAYLLIKISGLISSSKNYAKTSGSQPQRKGKRAVLEGG